MSQTQIIQRLRSKNFNLKMKLLATRVVRCTYVQVRLVKYWLKPVRVPCKNPGNLYFDSFRKVITVMVSVIFVLAARQEAVFFCNTPQGTRMHQVRKGHSTQNPNFCDQKAEVGTYPRKQKSRSLFSASLQVLSVSHTTDFVAELRLFPADRCVDGRQEAYHKSKLLDKRGACKQYGQIVFVIHARCTLLNSARSLQRSIASNLCNQ